MDDAWTAVTTPFGFETDDTVFGQPVDAAVRSATSVFLRRTFSITADQYKDGGSSFALMSASDDFCNVFVNGYHASVETYVTTGTMGGHEFEYWNRNVQVPPSKLMVGTNTLAVELTNSAMSSDLYFDLELEVLVGVPSRATTAVAVTPAPPSAAAGCTGCCKARTEGCLCGILAFECLDDLECVLDTQLGDKYCVATASHATLSLPLAALATLMLMFVMLDTRC